MRDNEGLRRKARGRGSGAGRGSGTGSGSRTGRGSGPTDTLLASPSRSAFTSTLPKCKMAARKRKMAACWASGTPGGTWEGGGLQLYGCGGLPGKGESSKGKGPALSSRIPQLYGSGGPPPLPSPPSNPYAHSILTYPPTLWFRGISRPSQSSKQSQCPLDPLNCHNSMALEDLQAYPVLQAIPVPTLSPRIPQLYDSGGPPGLPSPPSNPYAHSSPTHARTLWFWRTSGYGQVNGESSERKTARSPPTHPATL